MPSSSHSSRAPSRGWLDMEFSYEAPDGFRVPRNEIMRLLRSKQSTVRGPAGKVYVLDSESCDDFESLLSESGGRLGAEGKLALVVESGHIFGDFFDPGHRPPALKLPDLAEVRTRLGDLAPKLRDYQMAGVRWLTRAIPDGASNHSASGPPDAVAAGRGPACGKSVSGA